MRFKHYFYLILVLAFVNGAQGLRAETVSGDLGATEFRLDGGKEKKAKKLSKPSKHARQSARDARNAMKLKQQQVMGRAKVRLFFHNMFNRKYGKPVNFRSKRQRNRWKKGRMG